MIYISFMAACLLICLSFPIIRIKESEGILEIISPNATLMQWSFKPSVVGSQQLLALKIHWVNIIDQEMSGFKYLIVDVMNLKQIEGLGCKPEFLRLWQP